MEQAIYQLPYFQHENILTFIGAEKHKSIQREYWLITDYHGNGSLKDYLKSNVITWNQLTHIAKSMVRYRYQNVEILTLKSSLFK